MASYFERILGREKPAESTEMLQDVDNGLVAAKAEQQKREKLESLKAQLENLKKQREHVAANIEESKKKRSAITDDEIVRMAKVKGIKDSDISAYINGRISQRNADISNNQTEAIKRQAEAEAAAKSATEKAAKEQAIREKETQILELEQKLTDNAMKIVSGNKVEQKSALANNRTLNKQCENAMEDYKKLTGKEWVSNIDKEEIPEDSEVPENPSAVVKEPAEVLPEGFENWTEAEKAEYNSYGANEDKKNALVAKKKDEKERARKAKLAKDRRIKENTNEGKSSDDWGTAIYYANELVKDLKGKTATQIMESWGWNVSNHQKAGK